MPKIKKPRPALVTFSTNLVAIRHAAGLTQAVVAKKAGICVAYLSLLERAGRNPPLTLVVTLAEALKVDATALVRKAA
jgi:transcriptional regulator with XRE-family HTH domain